ncbi:hypothetical protein CDL12_03079 [Handroanthus impetiginosus]|uniref:Nucleolus and neural progenitor protein-like N-terminal domain-containing protein n=1 Tax=Handroanthus impetiginosus TaxID=429701 RepID=A0A2G9I361_9LAMI|nr:hypothetical protein CDL12_03079 [Handroanthus impetiginosus]
MGSEIETIEQRLKSFTGQLQTECGILERLVYKHKNQHRRSSYFQYVLKVRRDLKLLKLANLEEILDASFLVINGNRPKQKVQLLESLKRRRCSGGKYNFLERLLGVTRLLLQMVEPLLKAAMEISTLLARSFFLKFSLTILAVLARIRVLVQQILLDAVVVYNTVSSLSQREQTVRLNQDGFEVFREYYPRNEEASIMLECIWETDKFVLLERTCKRESNNCEEAKVSRDASKIQYDNIEVLLGVDESTTVSADRIDTEENGSQSNDEKHVSNITKASSADFDVFNNISEGMGMISEKSSKKLVEDGSCAIVPDSVHKLKSETKMKKKKVAFVPVKPPPPPAPSTRDESNFHLKNRGSDKKDPFFNLLTGGNNNTSLF